LIGMIVGFGIDVVDAGKIERVVRRFQDRFLERIFSEDERKYCMSKRRPHLHLAARFGAKEAFIKAVGARGGIKWTDVEVAREGGPPFLKLHGKAVKLAESKGVRKIHLALAHDAGMGMAGIILEG